ncbi:hypothetical protein K438DRAFT_1776152 [Mycena galopus ATCC 62051]|nr:hypothetical protein K438DRAFT_1776152 [Mycena galopus ATCC 62051]
MLTIASILAVDDAHPVMRNFKLHFKSTSWNVQASHNWIRNRSFDPSAALQEMLTPVFAALNAHELMRGDDLANRKIWGPGMILFQLLAIQAGRRERESLGEEVFLEEPVPKRHKLAAGKKIVRTATPPGVRRSGRLKKGDL